MAKKNDTTQYTPYMSHEGFKLNWSQVATSLLIGGILGAVSILRLSDSQTIILAGQGNDIQELKENSVLRPEYSQTILRIDQRLNSIEKNNDAISGKLDRLLER